MEKFEIGDVVRFKNLNELHPYELNDDDNIWIESEGVGMNWEEYVRCLTVIPFYVTDILNLHVKISSEDGSIEGKVYPQFLTHAEKSIDEPVKITSDAVNHPSHYTDGKIEVIDFIEDKGLNFHRGNAIKYIARAGKKNPDKEIEDLEKATWYINREIKRLKGEIEAFTGNLGGIKI